MLLKNLFHLYSLLVKIESAQQLKINKNILSGPLSLRYLREEQRRVEGKNQFTLISTALVGLQQLEIRIIPSQDSSQSSPAKRPAICHTSLLVVSRFISARLWLAFISDRLFPNSPYNSTNKLSLKIDEVFIEDRGSRAGKMSRVEGNI